MQEKKNRQLAIELKSIIKEFIFEKYGNVDITSEVMYGSSRRVVDMLFIYKNNIYGIEIKSEADNTSRLAGQIEEYKKIFDYILIFSSSNHVNKIKEKLLQGLGLFVVDNNSIYQIVKPLKNRETDKKEMLDTIPSSVIKEHFNIKGNLNSDEIRNLAFRHTKKEIHNLLLTHLHALILSRQSV